MDLGNTAGYNQFHYHLNKNAWPRAWLSFNANCHKMASGPFALFFGNGSQPAV